MMFGQTDVRSRFASVINFDRFAFKQQLNLQRSVFAVLDSDEDGSITVQIHSQGDGFACGKFTCVLSKTFSPCLTVTVASSIGTSAKNFNRN